MKVYAFMYVVFMYVCVYVYMHINKYVCSVMQRNVMHVCINLFCMGIQSYSLYINVIGRDIYFTL